MMGIERPFCNCSEPDKISETGIKILVFSGLFLKFYVTDTPQRKNVQHFWGSEQPITSDQPKRNGEVES